MTLELARSTDPRTSHTAAASQAANLTSLQQIVLTIFRRLDAVELGATDSEIANYYNSHYRLEGWPTVRFDTPRKRRSDLAGMGLIEDTGFRRLNPFGSPEAVWCLS